MQKKINFGQIFKEMLRKNPNNKNIDRIVTIMTKQV